MSFSQGRIAKGTKNCNHDDGGADHTNQTEEGNSVTSEIESVNHFLSCHFVCGLMSISESRSLPNVSLTCSLQNEA
jgi:hypothetical protein